MQNFFQNESFFYMINQPYNKSVSWVNKGHIITEVWCDTRAVTKYMTKVFF